MIQGDRSRESGVGSAVGQSSFTQLIQRFRKYAENAFWLIMEKGFALAAGMVVGIYVARYLRPEAFGLLNYAISFVGIFSALSTIGLEQILVRELSRNPERKEELLGTGVILRLAGSLVLIVCDGDLHGLHATRVVLHQYSFSLSLRPRSLSVSRSSIISTSRR
ncbi:MAG: oligosaccharide flippase family protein [Bacteroidota bacterium]